MSDVRKGEPVEVRDAWGEWHRAVTVSDVEGTHIGGRKVHDFPVVWVVMLNKRTAEALYRRESPRRIPWPVDAVRAAPPGVPDDFTKLHDWAPQALSGGE